MLNRFFLSIILCLLVGNIHAQTPLDSLINNLNHTENQETKANTLNTICLKLVYSYPDSALNFGLESLHIGRELNNNTIKAKAYNHIGIVFDVVNKWDTALIYYDSALRYAKISGDSITIASVLNNIGLVYWNQSIYDQAIENFMASLKLFEILGKDIGVANTYNNIALIYGEQNRNRESLQYHFKSLKKRQEIKDKNGINDSWLNIATVYYGLLEMDSANYYYQKVLPYFEKENNSYALGVCYNGLGEVNRVWKKKELSASYFEKSIEEHLKVHNHYKAASSLIGLAKLYQSFHDYHQALAALNRASKILKINSSLRTEVRVHLLLAEVYEAIKDFENASHFYKKYIELNDSLYHIDREQAIEEIMVAYETEKKEQQLQKEYLKNNLLEKENDLTQMKLSNRNKWLFGVVSFAFSVVFFLLFLNQKKLHKKQVEKDQAIIEERERGIKSVIQAQEEERARIAKDLHDGIGQQMSAIKMMFHTIENELSHVSDQIADKLKTISHTITNTANEIRALSHQMMPKSLTELGLVLALEDLLENSFASSNIKHTFESNGMEKRLPKKVELTLYRIAQELINNIVKHSQAKNIDIQLIKTISYCMLIMHDDGIGISADTNSNGIGIQNMNSRLRTVKGDLSLSSEEGKGTTATIKIALNG